MDFHDLTTKETKLKEAFFYERYNNGKFRCLTCRHRCLIGEGQLGLCKTRVVIDNKLYTYNYGNISSISLNPIEKKPLYHFYPGTYATTLGSWSCNFSCPWCQNYTITKVKPEINEEKFFLSPNKIVDMIIQDPNSSGVSFSFNEPTLMVEYALDILKTESFKKAKLYSGFVTNGYMTEDSLRELIDAGLSSLTVSLKGGKVEMKKYCNTNIDYIFENISIAFEHKMHLEIVVLVIPTVSDSLNYFNEISSAIFNNYSESIPLHFNAYYPAYKFHLPRTSVDILEKARDIAMKNGLNYVYIGNILGHPALNTYCPNCKEIVIARSQSRFIKNYLINKNKCPKCDFEIYVIN